MSERCSNWYKWCFAADTFDHLEGKPFSLFLIFAASVMWILRRLSLFEHAHHFLCKKKKLPIVTDIYILVFWSVAVFLAIAEAVYGLPENNWLMWLVLFNILQVVQTSFYHEFWVTMRKKTKTHPGTNRIRSLLIASGNYCYITWLFGLVYWWNRTLRFQEGIVTPGFQEGIVTPFDAIYFSFVTASTLGYGEIHPSVGNGLVQGIVVFQTLSTLFLIVILISKCVGSIDPLPEQQNDEKKGV